LRFAGQLLQSAVDDAGYKLQQTARLGPAAAVAVEVFG
jgi:hypothetical protein